MRGLKSTDGSRERESTWWFLLIPQHSESRRNQCARKQRGDSGVQQSTTTTTSDLFHAIDHHRIGVLLNQRQKLNWNHRKSHSTRLIRLFRFWKHNNDVQTPPQFVSSCGSRAADFQFSQQLNGARKFNNSLGMLTQTEVMFFRLITKVKYTEFKQEASHLGWSYLLAQKSRRLSKNCHMVFSLIKYQTKKYFVDKCSDADELFRISYFVLNNSHGFKHIQNKTKTVPI